MRLLFRLTAIGINASMVLKGVNPTATTFVESGSFVVANDR